jgi:hypothetical protein
MAKNDDKNDDRDVPDNVTDLAAVAAQGLDGEAADGALPGMEYGTHVKFAGMALRTNDAEYKLGDRVTFRVSTTCIGIGDEMLKDQHRRHLVKMQVESVEPEDDGR